MWYKKFKLDFQLVHNIYYKSGTFFIGVTLLLNILGKYKMISYELSEVRFYTIFIGIPLFVYGIYNHYKIKKDNSFLIQTIFGFGLGSVIIAITILIK